MRKSSSRNERWQARQNKRAALVQQDILLDRLVLGGIMVNGFAPLDKAGLDLHPEDFAAPQHGEVMRLLRENTAEWSPGAANFIDIQAYLERAELAHRVGQGSAAVLDLITPAEKIDEAVFVLRGRELIDASIERQTERALHAHRRGAMDRGKILAVLQGLQERATAVSTSIGAVRLAKELDARRFSYESRPLRPVPVFRIGEHAISTAGNLTALAAQAKAGKSAFLGGMIAAALNPSASEEDTLGVSSCGAGTKAIIHFDTEQSTFDHDAVVRLALQRAGLTNKPASLRSYCLTDVSVGERLEMMRFELERAHREWGAIFTVFLDGVGDLVRNPNDPDEAFEFVGELHRLAIRYNCVFIVVLHENPSAAESAKTRGHLGSHLERKAETNLRLMKTDGVTTVWTDRGARHCDIPKAAGIRFAYSQTERRHCLMESANDARSKAAIDELAASTASVFDGHQELSWSELRNRIMTLVGIKEGGARKRIEKMAQLGLIQKNLFHKYEFCG